MCDSQMRFVDNISESAVSHSSTRSVLCVENHPGGTSVPTLLMARLFLCCSRCPGSSLGSLLWERGPVGSVAQGREMSEPGPSTVSLGQSLVWAKPYWQFGMRVLSLGSAVPFTL